jgi:hypothetical protein
MRFVFAASAVVCSLHLGSNLAAGDAPDIDGRRSALAVARRSSTTSPPLHPLTVAAEQLLATLLGMLAFDRES